MSNEFVKPLAKNRRGSAERRIEPRPEPTPAPGRRVESGSVEARHRKWFASFANEYVLPLLTDTVAALKQRGFNAHCRLGRDGEEVTGELVIVPPGLPHGARPPRFTVAAAQGPNGLAIEFTGTFPHAGAEGGFGGEVQYDTIYTSELQSTLTEFVRLTTGD